MSYLTTRAELLTTAVPESTRTYGALPHGDLLNMVENNITQNGFNINNVEYRAARAGEVMVTYYTLESPMEDMKPMIAVMNSYNKMKPVTLATGAKVMVCLNGMICGEDIEVLKKRHTKGIKEYTKDLVDSAVKNTENTFLKISKDVSKLSSKRLDGYTEISHILGELHLRDNIITTNQMTKAMSEVRSSKNWKMDDSDNNSMTSWHLYNNVTEALKSSHPLNEIQSFGKVHDYFLDYASV